MKLFKQTNLRLVYCATILTLLGYFNGFAMALVYGFSFPA